MEKKIWTKPEISVVEFEANEYVAACATGSSPTYSATCWDPTSDFDAGSTFVLFGDSDSNGSLTFSYNSEDGRYDYEDPLYECTDASDILQTYGAGTSTTGDYAIFNSVMFSDEPHKYNTINGYNGLHNGENHSFNSTDYSALYDGFILSQANASTGITDGATKVKYMFANSMFHLFKFDGFTTKNMMS